MFLFWWLCLHPVSVLFVSLTAETISEEGHLTKGAELCREKLEGCWGPVGTALLRQLLESFFPFITHIIVGFRNKDITLENQDSTKVILKFQLSLTLLFKAKMDFDVCLYPCLLVFQGVPHTNFFP